MGVCMTTLIWFLPENLHLTYGPYNIPGAELDRVLTIKKSGRTVHLVPGWGEPIMWMQPSPRRGRASPDHMEKLAHRDGFGLVAVETGGENLRALVAHGGGRDRDDGDALCYSVVPESCQGREPVHAGELEIHQDERRLCLPRQAKPVFAVSASSVR